MGVLPLVAALCALLCCTAAYTSTIEANDKYCVAADAIFGGQVTGSFEVISETAKPIVVTVNGPAPRYILHFESKFDALQAEIPDDVFAEGSFTIDIELEGEYTMCIANTESEEKIVAFNFRATPVEDKSYKYPGLEEELNELHEGLDLLRDHQSYMNQRERVHQETLESINQKVVFWTVLEAIVVIGVAMWQLRYISTFFEVKRRM